MYRGLPRLNLSLTELSLLTNFANPKSAIFTLEFFRRILAGLRSRWI
jgi:hypothetical protein